VAEPTPQPKTNPPSWLSIAATIGVAILGTLHAVGPVGPVSPPKPGPVPPVVNPVDPAPAPPTPIEPPSPIATGVTVSDLHGNPLGNSVEAGHSFAVTAANGLTLTAIPTATPKDSDVIEFSDSKLICTLRNGALLQIVVTGGGVKPSIVAIQCNHAPQPPPVVPVVSPPVNPPAPSPAPVSSGVRVVILRDAMRALTKEQVTACDSPKVTELLNAKCAKDSAGRPAWHRWEKDVDVSDLPNWKQLIDATRAKISSDSLKLPLLMIEVGNKLHLYEISDEAAMLNTLNAAFAGGL